MDERYVFCLFASTCSIITLLCPLLKQEAADTRTKLRNCRSKLVHGEIDFSIKTFSAIIRDLLHEYDVNDPSNDPRYREIKQDLCNARVELP